MLLELTDSFTLKILNNMTFSVVPLHIGCS